MLKIVFKFLTLVILAVYLVFAIVHWAHPQEDELCSGVDYLVRHRGEVPERSIVDVRFVANLMKRAHLSPVGKQLKDVNLRGLKAMLEKNVYIDSAFCYYTAAGTLCVGVVPKVPVMQVITPTKKYFLTDRGNTMPMGKYELGLPQVTGDVSVARARKLLPLLQHIRHSHWKDQVEKVRLDPGQGLLFVMRDEPFEVVMGSEEDYEEKLQNLELFLEKALPKVERDKYAFINVAFEGQVVAVKKKKKTS